MLDLYLFRHGESEMNVQKHLVGGRSNEAKLTDEGESQATLLGKRIKQHKINFDLVFASSAQRAKKTAQLACQEINFPLEDIEYSDEILELSQGDWQGKLRSECYTPEVMKILETEGWDFKAPNGESRREVEVRMMNFLDTKIMPLYDESKKINVAVFGHGMAFKCLLRAILDFDQSMTYKIVLDNTSITQLRFEKRGWFIEKINDGGHVTDKDAYYAYENLIYGTQYEIK